MNSLPPINFASIRQAFGQTLTRLAKTNKKIFVVSADLKSSLHLSVFASRYPRRFIECGVAESSAAAVSAGLAHAGKTVFLCSFSCFSPAINWASIKQSICYPAANVKIIGSHSGLLSGTLGASHQMLEDIALTSCLPHMQVFSPCDALETQKLISTLSHSPCPSYIRLVRPSTPIFFPKNLAFTIGKSHILQKGTDITIIGHGPILYQAFQVIPHCPASLEIINCSSVKPLDTATIKKSVAKTGRLIVIEDHQQTGGLGQIIAAFLLRSHLSPAFIHLAVKDSFGQSAKNHQDLYNHYGIGTRHLLAAIQKLTQK